MKKHFFLIFIVTAFVAAPSFAQIKKGSTFLGGDIGGSSQKTTYSTSTNAGKQNGFYFSPVFGKAIKDNLVFGVNALVNIYNTQTTGTTDETKQHYYGGGIFIRKYKPVGKSGFSLFAQGNLGYNYYSSKTNPSASNFNNDKRNTIGINITPGLSYTLTPKLQLEAGLANILALNYFTEKQDVGGIVPGSAKTHGFNVGGSIDNASSIYVGFRLLLN